MRPAAERMPPTDRASRRGAAWDLPAYCHDPN